MIRFTNHSDVVNLFRFSEKLDFLIEPQSCFYCYKTRQINVHAPSWIRTHILIVWVACNRWNNTVQC